MHFVEAKGILSKDNGINIYRGCSHGCIYCDSRSVCYGFDHVFEDIEVKENAPKLCNRAGIMHNPDECFSYLHEFPNNEEQLSLF